MNHGDWDQLRTPKAIFDAIEESLMRRHGSPRTAEAYVRWTRRFIAASGRKHPRELGPTDVVAFLSRLATRDQVSASTQNQALAALLFLYKEVLGQPLEFLDAIVHAQRPKRLPTVLGRDEMASLLAHLEPPWLLMAKLLYGAGLRLMECATLRVKDVDFGRHQLTVRRAKSAKDRVTLLPVSLETELREHLEKRRAEHERDLARGRGSVEIPFALGRKFPNAGTEFRWQWVFPATRFYRDELSGVVRRHHLHETALQRAVRQAGLDAGIPKPANAPRRASRGGGARGSSAECAVKRRRVGSVWGLLLLGCEPRGLGSAADAEGDLRCHRGEPHGPAWQSAHR